MTMVMMMMNERPSSSCRGLVLCVYISGSSMDNNPYGQMSNYHAQFVQTRCIEEKKRKQVRIKVGVIIAQLKTELSLHELSLHGAVYM